MNRDFLLRDRPIAPDGSLDGASFPASSSFDKVGVSKYLGKEKVFERKVEFVSAISTPNIIFLITLSLAKAGTRANQWQFCFSIIRN